MWLPRLRDCGLSHNWYFSLTITRWCIISAAGSHACTPGHRVHFSFVNRCRTTAIGNTTEPGNPVSSIVLPDWCIPKIVSSNHQQALRELRGLRMCADREYAPRTKRDIIYRVLARVLNDTRCFSFNIPPSLFFFSFARIKRKFNKGNWVWADFSKPRNSK